MIEVIFLNLIIRVFDLNIGITFVQDNESKSCRGVLRGFHFQKPPYTGKIS